MAVATAEGTENMKKQSFRALVIAALSILGTVGAASADTITVSYYTTGVFCTTQACTTTQSTLQADQGSGHVTVTFAGSGSLATPNTLSNPDAGSTNQPFGTFTVTRTGSANVDFSPAGYFQLSIFQVDPTAGSGQLIGNVTGKINDTASLSFAPNNAISIGDVNYTLNALSLASGSGSSPHYLTGTITHDEGDVPAVPEPTSLLLLGSGLAAVGGVIRRRTRA